MDANLKPLCEALLDRGYVIAIDGPSGSGKSTIARVLAADLSLDYLDTGAMYRALTWWLLSEGVALDDADAVGERARRLPLDVSLAPHAAGLRVAGVNVTDAIRQERISAAVSQVAAYPEVRSALIERQRDYIRASRASGKGIAAEGRDITTVVAPDADLRLLITASPEERHRRRQREIGGDVAASMDRRDATDSRVNDFTNPAPGVRLIDTTEMTIEQVVAAIGDLVRDTL